MADPPGLVLHPGASVGEDVSFGANVVVHDGVEIGDGVVVQDNVVLGKPPSLRPQSMAAGEVGRLTIGAGARICAGAIVFAGATLGEQALLGDQTYVRERASLGPRTIVGRGSAIESDVTIGADVRIQAMVYLSSYSVVEDDVFMGPGALTANDDTMSRHGPEHPLRGPVLRRACRVGASAILVPGVEVGEEAFVAAGAVVANDVPARAVVMGVPARVVRRVSDEDLLERWR